MLAVHVITAHCLYHPAAASCDEAEGLNHFNYPEPVACGGTHSTQRPPASGALGGGRGGGVGISIDIYIFICINMFLYMEGSRQHNNRLAGHSQ